METLEISLCSQALASVNYSGKILQQIYQEIIKKQTNLFLHTPPPILWKLYFSDYIMDIFLFDWN